MGIAPTGFCTREAGARSWLLSKRDYQLNGAEKYRMSSGNTRKLSAEITEIKEAERRKEKRTIRNKINKKKYLFFLQEGKYKNYNLETNYLWFRGD